MYDTSSESYIILCGSMVGSVNVVYEENLGVVDFHPSKDVGIVYVSEADLVSGQTYKRKLVKLRKVNRVRGLVMAEQTPISNQQFKHLQKFTIIELGLHLLSIGSQSDAAHLLAQMVNVENRTSPNQFKIRWKGPVTDASVLATVQLIPKLGETKASALLQRFHSIKGICDASEEELSQVVGKAIAGQVKSFLTQPSAR